jgi:hypothetical protein
MKEALRSTAEAPHVRRTEVEPSMGLDLSGMSARELLRLFAGVMEALRDRGAVKTGNNPVADYAELLVCRAFGLEGQVNSNQGFDARDSTTGDRYEVKARRVTVHNKPTRLSPLRDFDKHHFDYLVVVTFTPDFSVERAVRLPWASVEAVSSHNAHLNGRVVFLRDALWCAEGVEDVTERLRVAEAAV